MDEYVSQILLTKQEKMSLFIHLFDLGKAAASAGPFKTNLF